jgi:hypothetical protein
MERHLRIFLGFLFISVGAGCNFNKIFDAGPSKAALHECEDERQRLDKELSLARTQRDQHRGEYEKLKPAEKPESPGPSMVSTPADAQIRAAKKQADDAAAETRLAKENLVGANSRVNALEKQVADLQQQAEKLRSSLASESQLRAAAQIKALTTDQAIAQAAQAKATQADLQKQLDAAILDKQKLTQEIEALKNK